MNSLDILLLIWWFVLGGVLGSFLNVVIYRVPRKESLVWPGSHCPHCGHIIRWYDNLPVLSWFLLGGRCRDCRSPISTRYPIIEALSAMIVGCVALGISGGRWSLVLAGVSRPWLAPLHGTILEVLAYSSYFLTVLAAAVIAWDGRAVPWVLWLPAWLLVAIAIVLGPLIQGVPLPHIPPFSWFSWGLALVLGSVAEIMLGSRPSHVEPVRHQPQAVRHHLQKGKNQNRKKVRRRSQSQLQQNAEPRSKSVFQNRFGNGYSAGFTNWLGSFATRSKSIWTQSIDLISLVALPGFLFTCQQTLFLGGFVLLASIFARVSSWMVSDKTPRSPEEAFGREQRRRALVLGVGFLVAVVSLLVNLLQ